MSTIVDVQDLHKNYRSRTWGFRRRDQKALRGVSLQANAGEVFGLLGPNGAGKTTLIKILLGVVKPTGGGASLFGLPVGSSQARQRVGYLPESLRVDRHHTARSALRYYGRLSRMSRGDIARRSDELLELVGLRGRDKESVRRFSKGMYQRLGLAQALMHDPDLLVLDEPTDGLDPVGRNEVRNVIDRLRESGKTIFLNSHILQEVELVCTRVAVLAQGNIKAIGAISDLGGGEAMHCVNLSLSGELVSDLNAEVVCRNLQTVLPNVTFDASSVERGPSDSLSGNPVWAIRLPAKDQSDIDALVDHIRSQGISIQHLEVPRASLEETFMSLVGPREGEAS